MALFKRADLKAKGLNDEQIEYVLTESSRSLAANYITKADSDAAVEAAKAGSEQDPTQSEAYLQLAAKAAKLEAFQGDDFAAVKAPYRDMIWGQLDHSAEHKPYAEQLAGIKSTMPDLFAPDAHEDKEAQKPPQFGAQPGGSIPGGKDAPSFADVWGFVPKK
jgi:hypothetical protein